MMTVQKRKLTIRNRDKRGAVTIEGRLSRGYRRYESLPVLPQFPVTLGFEETTVLEVGDAREFLFYRSLPNSHRDEGCIYRTALPEDRTEFKCDIWAP